MNIADFRDRIKTQWQNVCLYSLFKGECSKHPMPQGGTLYITTQQIQQQFTIKKMSSNKNGKMLIITNNNKKTYCNCIIIFRMAFWFNETLWDFTNNISFPLTNQNKLALSGANKHIFICLCYKESVLLKIKITQAHVGQTNACDMIIYDVLGELTSTLSVLDNLIS